MARKRTDAEARTKRATGGGDAADLRDARQRNALLEARVEELSRLLDETRREAAGSAELRRALEHLEAQLDHMSELGKELNALSFDQVRDACERHLPFIVSAHKMSLYVYDEERKKLLLRASNHGQPIDETVDASAGSPSLMVKAIERGPLLLIRDVDAFRDEHGLATASGRAKAYETKSCAIAPLSSGGKVLGVLNLADKKDGSDFTEVTDRKFIQQVADLVAIALRNCLLLDKLRRVQATDSLTQLMNRPAFIARLDLECKRAVRYRSKLAVVLVDVNRFRLINSNYGHAVGDNVLTEVARELEVNLREIDVVGRHGGDEFAILLPHQDAAGAQVVVDRLSLLDIRLHPPAESEPILVKLTAALAELREGETGSEVLENAEAALAEAKGKSA